MSTPLRPLAVVVAAVTVAATLLLSTGPASAATANVPVGDLWFCSASFQNGTCTTTINAGDTVTWDLGGATIAHTSTSDTGVWNSGTLQAGGSYQFTFNQAGSFAYHCEIHQVEMKGVIVVQAAASSPTATLVTSGTFPLATVRPSSTPGGTLPAGGQGPDSTSTSWWLLGALLGAGVITIGAGVAYRVRAH